MAKFGQLILAGGRWNRRQIVSRDWIDTSTAPKIEGTGGLFYGYLWWLVGRCSMGVRYTGLARLVVAGSIRIVPELDLVVVVTAGYYQSVSSAVRHFQGCLAGDLAPLSRGAAKGANDSIAVANATVTPAAQLGTQVLHLYVLQCAGFKSYRSSEPRFSLRAVM